MEDNIKLKVKYELSDMLKFNFWHIKKFTRGCIIFLGLWLFFILTIFSIDYYNNGILYALSNLIGVYRGVISLFAIFLLLIGLFYLIIYNTSKRFVKSNHIWSEEKEIVIDENGISVCSASASLNIKWSEIEKYINTKDLIALYYSRNTAILIPKRNIIGCEEKLMDCLKRHNIKKELRSKL